MDWWWTRGDYDCGGWSIMGTFYGFQKIKTKTQARAPWLADVIEEEAVCGDMETQTLTHLGAEATLSEFSEKRQIVRKGAVGKSGVLMFWLKGTRIITSEQATNRTDAKTHPVFRSSMGLWRKKKKGGECLKKCYVETEGDEEHT